MKKRTIKIKITKKEAQISCDKGVTLQYIVDVAQYFRNWTELDDSGASGPSFPPFYTWPLLSLSLSLSRCTETSSFSTDERGEGGGGSGNSNVNAGI